MWRYLDGAVRAATQLGNRLVTVNYIGAHPDHDYFDTLDDNERHAARPRTARQAAASTPGSASSIPSTPTRPAAPR